MRNEKHTEPEETKKSHKEPRMEYRKKHGTHVENPSIVKDAAELEVETDGVVANESSQDRDFVDATQFYEESNEEVDDLEANSEQIAHQENETVDMVSEDMVVVV